MQAPSAPWLRVARVALLVALLLAFGGAGTAVRPALAAAQACNWSGQWSRTEGRATVTLSQVGNQVTGDDGMGDLITGTVLGNRFTGRWTHGSDSGALDLTIDSACANLSGTFGWPGSRPPDPFHATRLGPPPPPAAPPPVPAQPPVLPPPAAPPAANPVPARNLGGVDVNAYCATTSYVVGDVEVWPFDGAAVVQGAWSCTGTDSFGLGISVEQPVDLNDVCRWQYNQPDAVARQTTAGDPASWRCFAGG